MKRLFKAGRRSKKKDEEEFGAISKESCEDVDMASCAASGLAVPSASGSASASGLDSTKSGSGERSEGSDSKRKMESYRYAMHQYSNTIDPYGEAKQSSHVLHPPPPPPPPPGPPPQRRSYDNLTNLPALHTAPSPAGAPPRDLLDTDLQDSQSEGNLNNLNNLNLQGPHGAQYSSHTFSEDSQPYPHNAHNSPNFQNARTPIHSGKSVRKSSYVPEPEMPDATYEEYYGDAYVGGTIKYLYPSGYQSMRPRSGPWKLSIAVCVLFLWLTVFIVGHCSDRVDLSAYNVNGNEIDDDELVIETRWCGSRLLYFMWVVSVLITGIATAYVGIIGYIKVRDFAVANCRSQPPGMVGKSDYYVRLDDVALPTTDPRANHNANADYSSYQASTSHPYRRTIYQSDGTPQFWGSHIYRPTQAAVAVTSR